MTNPGSATRSAGAVALAVAGLLDVVTAVLAFVGPAADAPPAAVLIVLVVVGLVSAAGLAGSRGGLIAAYVARVISAGLGIPAFFLDAPPWVLVVVVVEILLSVAGIWLTLPMLRRSAATPSRLQA